ncbi:MAG: hypothetical protein AB7V26_03025 [Lysobacterales bacterium]
MLKRLKWVALALAGAALAGCGGGGGQGDAFNPAPITLALTVTTGQPSTTPKSLVDVLVSARLSNGNAPADGTPVTLQVTPAGVGQLSFISNGNTGIVFGDRVEATLVGGIANFRFHSRAIGTAVLTASANATFGATPVSATANSNISVVAGPPSDPRLVMQATTLVLPTNPQGVAPFLGSPFLSEVTLTWRRLNGELVTVFGPTGDGTIAVSVNPVINTAGFSTPDDPETDDIDEFLLHLAQAPVNVVAGKSTVFMQSLDQPTTAVMTAAAIDPDTGETVEAQLTFTMVNGAAPLPGSIDLSRAGFAVYVQGSGGRNAEQISAAIKDGAGGTNPDPVSGGFSWNNLQMELVGGSVGGDRLRSVNAQGATVQGNLVKVRTNNGIASITYESGTQTRTAQLRATADRADNNVDNGITDPVTSVISLTVSDGKLFDLDLSAALSAVAPATPGGRLSLTMSAIATDRLGNPVVPGTEIRFGTIDEPLDNNFFAISGLTGDPQEGGVNFVDANGGFTTQGAGAGPGDTLLVFGEDVPGNRDLEAARVVQSIAGNTSLTVNRRFNFNDDTGASVNSGGILPYVIGRSVDGNINAVAFTDAAGVARSELSYSVDKLGKLAAVHAEGNGDLVSGTPELVTDVEFVRYRGVGALQLIANPVVIPGNRTEQVELCSTDAQGNPIRGTEIDFAFASLAGGTGRVDGVATSGTIANVTGADGCVTVSVQTLGIVSSTGGTAGPRVNFSAEGDTASVNIVVGAVTLSASPPSLSGDGGRLIQLTLKDSDGVAIQGAVITATCTANGGGSLTVTTPPPPTNGAGQANTVVTASGFNIIPPATGPTGQCVFTVGNPAAASATVAWTSVDQCSLFSPQAPAGCPSATINLTIFGNGSSLSSPTGLTCNGPTLGACSATFAPATPVNVSLNTAPTAWGGDCAAFAAAQAVTIVTGANGSVINCTVTFP